VKRTAIAAALAVVLRGATGLAAAANVAGSAEAGDPAPYTFSIGPFVPSYAPPAAGTYELPPIGAVGDHPLIDASGAKTTLAAVVGGRMAVVSFIYGTCSEKTGCPLATAVLHRLDERIAANPDMAQRVALVSISFDPAHDADRLAAMQRMRAPGSTWAFVTAPDEAALGKLLADFGQSITMLRTADGRATGKFRHVLKVYLLDRAQNVRNIYSVGFLHPDLVWNDLETLRMEQASRASAGAASRQKSR